MCRTNRISAREWLAEVQRDPVTLGETRRRIECLLSEPFVARAVARRLARAQDAAACARTAPLDTVSQAPRQDVPARIAPAAPRAATSTRGVLRDFILADDGAFPGHPFVS